MKFYKLFFFIIFLVSALSNFGQGFESYLFGGINASQLQGDNLSGFDKVGLHTGLGVEYEFVKNSLSLELLFNQKGSASKANRTNSIQKVNTTLNYLQIPVLYSINSWYDEADNFYHIGVHGGPYYSRLFNINSTDPGLDRFIDNFKKADFGLVLGVKYRISRKIATTLRYDQSLQKIYENSSNNISGIISYLVTLRIEVYL